MPESPVSAGKFSEAPPAKAAMTADEMQSMISDKLQTAAKILGGTVAGQPSAAPEPAQERSEEAPVPLDVPVEDRKNYIRSLLAKEPFQKKYELFGGNLIVTFKTRKTVENELVSNQPEADRHKSKLVTSLVSLMVGQTRSAFDQLDDIASAAVYAVFGEFEELCEELFRRANDPDFWTGTAGRI
jgi:hypothetical protein